MVSSGTAVNVATLPSQQQATVWCSGEALYMLDEEEALLCGPTEAQ